MSYILRTKDGIATAYLNNTAAQKIISTVQGHFRPWMVPGKQNITVYEIDEDARFGIGGLAICLWKKMILVPQQ